MSEMAKEEFGRNTCSHPSMDAVVEELVGDVTDMTGVGVAGVGVGVGVGVGEGGTCTM